MLLDRPQCPQFPPISSAPVPPSARWLLRSLGPPPIRVSVLLGKESVRCVRTSRPDHAFVTGRGSRGMLPPHLKARTRTKSVRLSVRPVIPPPWPQTAFNQSRMKDSSSSYLMIGLLRPRARAAAVDEHDGGDGDLDNSRRFALSLPRQPERTSTSPPPLKRMMEMPLKKDRWSGRKGTFFDVEFNGD